MDTPPPKHFGVMASLVLAPSETDWIMTANSLKTVPELHSRAIECLWVGNEAVSTSFGPHGLQPSRLLCPWDFPSKNTGMGHHFLLQGIFLTQGSNLHLLHWQVDSLPLIHQGSPYKAQPLNALAPELGQNVSFRKLGRGAFSEVWGVRQEELEICHLEEKTTCGLTIKCLSCAPHMELLVPGKVACCLGKVKGPTGRKELGAAVLW